MTAGMQDYSSITRPKYGGALQDSSVVAVGANAVTLLSQITGKGVIYGGSVWLDHTSAQGNSEIALRLDGEWIFSEGFLRMKDYGIINPRSSIVTVNVYDPENYIYSAGLSYGITFEKSFDLAYWEWNGTTPTVHYNIVYALL